MKRKELNDIVDECSQRAEDARAQLLKLFPKRNYSKAMDALVAFQVSYRTFCEYRQELYLMDEGYEIVQKKRNK